MPQLNAPSGAEALGEGVGRKSLSERLTHSDGLSTVLGRSDGEETPLAGHALEQNHYRWGNR